MNSGHSTKSDDRDSGSFYYFAKLLTCEFDHGHAKKKRNSQRKGYFTSTS